MSTMLSMEERMKKTVLPLFTGICMTASSIIYPIAAQTIEIETTRLSGPFPAAERTAVVEEMHDVFFDFNSARIRVDAEPVLLDNAEILRQNPEAYIVIEGYCSKAESGTRGLAQVRADQVKEYMVSEGVDPERIITVGKCSLYQMSQSADIHQELDQRVHFTSLDKYSDNDFFFG
jgi:outer membrane protein OmpA-like peptidoglycan-associated protein